MRLSVGSVEVTSQVVSFRRRLHSGEVLGEHPLDLPQHRLVTEGVWWTMPPELLAAAGVAEVAVACSAGGVVGAGVCANAAVPINRPRPRPREARSFLMFDSFWWVA